MRDYSHYLTGELKDYVLWQLDPHVNSLVTCGIWYKPIGGPVIIADDRLAEEVKRWMVEAGVPIVQKPPLDEESQQLPLSSEQRQEMEEFFRMIASQFEEGDG